MMSNLDPSCLQLARPGVRVWWRWRGRPSLLVTVCPKVEMGKLGSPPGMGWWTLPLGPVCPLRLRVGR